MGSLLDNHIAVHMWNALQDHNRNFSQKRDVRKFVTYSLQVHILFILQKKNVYKTSTPHVCYYPFTKITNICNKNKTNKKSFPRARIFAIIVIPTFFRYVTK